MAVVAQDIKDTFSEFAGTNEATINIWLGQAQRRINRTQWGEKADDATLWLTGHLLKIECQLRSGGSAPAGPIKTQKVGELWVTYEIPKSMGSSFLSSTTYGREYLSLMKTVWPGRVLCGCDPCEGTCG